MSRKILFTIVLLLLTCLARAEPRILVVTSNDNRFFNTSISTLRQNLPADISVEVVGLEQFKTERGNIHASNLVISLGYEAAEYLSNTPYDAPHLHAYLTEFQHHQQRHGAVHSSILLDQPLHRYIAFTRLLLSIDQVGILTTDERQLTAEKINRISTLHNIDIIDSVYHEDDNLIDTLRNLLHGVDALLALPAPEIYNRNSLKGILLTAYRLNKPVISYSPSHAVSGALASIYTSPQNIGQQLAQMSVKILRQPGFIPEPFYYADSFDISINEDVADSLNLKLPSRERILQLLLQQEGQQ